MPELSKETAALLHYLLPGLLAAWVFYGLTSHKKPSQFERVIQALIFTFLVQALLPIAQWLLESVGTRLAIRPWDNISETLTSAFIAVFLGASFAILANKDSFHKSMRAIGFTTRTSHPSEWHGVLSERQNYVVLHLSDERRLSGYPQVWPSEYEKGHFFIVQPAWLSEEGEQTLLKGIEGFLINAKDVKWVEFIEKRKEE
ncbi:MAG: DUF6338 family protein [Betaproteobacteria bacterium]|jgi:hypothetical protein|nr:DUF6338 family protein [Betaproteobacteria bacterium]